MKGLTFKIPDKCILNIIQSLFNPKIHAVRLQRSLTYQIYGVIENSIFTISKSLRLNRIKHWYDVRVYLGALMFRDREDKYKTCLVTVQGNDSTHQKFLC